ncbi:MAG: YlbF family regulator [Limisphaerales bacterium]
MEIDIKSPREMFDGKIRELCQTLVDHKDFQAWTGNIKTFMEDEKAKFEYQMINELGGMLQQKQSMGAEITEEEAGKFESLRESFTKNENAMAFVKTQERLQQMQDHILRHVQRTFEVGHVPTDEEMEEGMCCDYTSGFEDPQESEGCSKGECETA